MTSKAHAEFDPQTMGVRLAIMREGSGPRQYLTWEQPSVVSNDDEGYVEPDPKVWLRLHDEDARALYEALADHFGHAGHDIRALRKDYNDERGRVDKLITHLTRGA